MRFICSTFGSAGDVFPMLGLALELNDRGHEVTLATNEHFADVVTESGVPFEPLGSAEAFHATIRSPDRWHPQRGFRHVFGSLSPALRDQYALHARWAGNSGVVGITNCFGFGALMAQEKLGMPVIALYLQPAVLWSRFSPPRVPGGSRRRARAVPRGRRCWQEFPRCSCHWLTISLTTPPACGGWASADQWHLADLPRPRLQPRLRPLLASHAVTKACHDVAERLAPRDGLRRSAIAIEDHVTRFTK